MQCMSQASCWLICREILGDEVASQLDDVLQRLAPVVQRNAVLAAGDVHTRVTKLLTTVRLAGGGWEQSSSNLDRGLPLHWRPLPRSLPGHVRVVLAAQPGGGPGPLVARHVPLWDTGLTRRGRKALSAKLARSSWLGELVGVCG
jgi:hypothetical protein